VLSACAGNFCVDLGVHQTGLSSAYVVLVDFGFARALPTSLVLHAEFGGTPDYASTRCSALVWGLGQPPSRSSLTMYSRSASTACTPILAHALCACVHACMHARRCCLDVAGCSLWCNTLETALLFYLQEPAVAGDWAIRRPGVPGLHPAGGMSPPQDCVKILDADELSLSA